MQNVWINPKSFKPSEVKKEITKKLTDTYKHKWLDDLASKTPVSHTEHLKMCLHYKNMYC